MLAVRALNHIRAPRRIVETRAALRTHHSAIAGIEITALAQGETVSLILTQKLIGSHFCDGASGPRPELFSECATLHVVQIHDERVLALVRHLVKLWEPLHFTIADQWIGRQKKLRQAVFCKVKQENVTLVI